jgi:hypothetical protein
VGDAVPRVVEAVIGRGHQTGEGGAAGLLELDDQVIAAVPAGTLHEDVVAG